MTTRDGVVLATRRVPPRRHGTVPDADLPGTGRPLVGVHRRVHAAQPARSGRARLRGGDPGGARAGPIAATVGTRSCTSATTARTASTGCSPSRGATAGIGSYGTAYSAVGATQMAALGRDELKAIVVLGTGADYHDGWIYTSGAFELGWNVYWVVHDARRSRSGASTSTTPTRAELKRPPRRGDHRRPGDGGPAAAARPPAAHRGRRHPVPRVARPPRLRRLLGRRRPARRRRADPHPDAVDRRMVGQLPVVAPRPLPGDDRAIARAGRAPTTASSSGRGSTATT